MLYGIKLLFWWIYKMKVLLGVTGSVAAIKVPELVSQLSEFAEVR